MESTGGLALSRDSLWHTDSGVHNIGHTMEHQHQIQRYTTSRSAEPSSIDHYIICNSVSNIGIARKCPTMDTSVSLRLPIHRAFTLTLSRLVPHSGAGPRPVLKVTQT